MSPPHFIIISFPVHGHLNPNLNLSNRLLRLGARVTFLTSSFTRLKTTFNTHQGLTFVEYDDGFSDKLKPGVEMSQIGCYHSESHSFGSLENSVKTPENESISCIDQLEELGLIVPWFSQIQALKHPAIACFFTHGGWNSTIESMINGVPMVGFPQMFDQFTNAKLMEDYFEVGMRLNCNSDGIVESGEIKRCLELVTGDEKLKENVDKWKKLAVEAVKEGGSSDKNLKDFVTGFVKD